MGATQDVQLRKRVHGGLCGDPSFPLEARGAANSGKGSGWHTRRPLDTTDPSSSKSR